MKRTAIRLLALLLAGVTVVLTAACDSAADTGKQPSLTAITNPGAADTGTQPVRPPITGTDTATDKPVVTTAPPTLPQPTQPTQPTSPATTAPPSSQSRRIAVEAGKKTLTAADYFPDEPDIAETDVVIETVLTKEQLADAGASYTVVCRYQGKDFNITVDIVDTTPPVIKVNDIHISLGETVSYKKYATVTDNSSNAVSLKIDNSAVDLDKTGSYPVIYTATDSSGNSATAQCKLVISEAKQITKEDVDPLIDNLIAELIEPGMSKWDTAYTLWYWCKTKIKYSYDYYDPTKIYAGAYEGLKNKTGDCYVYYATFALLLDRVGIENMRVSRVGGTSNHYWNLVNLGDGWYHCDPSPRRTGHTYYCFMQTDEQIAWYTEYYKEKPNYYTFDPDLYPPRETKIVFEHY